MIKVTGHREHNRVVYCVEDNGIGIAPEHQEKIFNIFHQLDPTVEGDGLGLTIIRRIIEKHEGEIRVESVPDKGSKFYVALPVVANFS